MEKGVVTSVTKSFTSEPMFTVSGPSFGHNFNLGLEDPGRQRRPLPVRPRIIIPLFSVDVSDFRGVLFLLRNSRFLSFRGTVIIRPRVLRQTNSTYRDVHPVSHIHSPVYIVLDSLISVRPIQTRLSTLVC